MYIRYIFHLSSIPAIRIDRKMPCRYFYDKIKELYSAADRGGFFVLQITEKNRVYLCLLMVIFLWGVNSVSIKYLTQFFPPVLLAAVRLLLASLFLFAFFVCTNKKRLLPRASWAPTVGVSLFCIFLHQIALTTGLKETSGTHAILILGLGPLFTMLFAAVFLKEKIFNCITS